MGKRANKDIYISKNGLERLFFDKGSIWTLQCKWQGSEVVGHHYQALPFFKEEITKLVIENQPKSHAGGITFVGDGLRIKGLTPVQALFRWIDTPNREKSLIFDGTEITVKINGSYFSRVY